MATQEDRRETDSGIEVKPVYTEEDVAGLSLEAPGEFPFTRGPYKDMYRGRPWTIRQYAGFGSAGETEKWAALALRSTRSPTWRSCSTRFPSVRSPPR